MYTPDQIRSILGKEPRVTPENIRCLGKNEIFVFGSNEAGRHGKGAALQALSFGAIKGKGTGLCGATYAIPTKNANLKTLPTDVIKCYVEDFAVFAKYHPELNFLVTKIGCGLALYEPSDIGPMFETVLELPNVVLPIEFLREILKYSEARQRVLGNIG